MTTPMITVEVRLPRGWIEIDPRVSDLDGDLRRAIRDEWGADLNGDAGPYVAQLLGPAVVELRRLAAAGDVVLVGLFCRVVPVEGVDIPLVFTANVVLAISAPGIGLRLLDDALPDGWRSRPVDLPAGPAVLITGDARVEGSDGAGAVPARVRRYVIAVPGTDRLVTLAFLTPNLDLGDAFVDVFDAVAASMTFGR